MSLTYFVFRDILLVRNVVYERKGSAFLVEVAKVTSKGQVTIPVSIRRRLNINEGDKLLFIDRPDGVMMVNPDNFEAEQASKPSEAKPTSMAEPRPKVEKSDTPKQPPKDYDVASLLNEIRSIGSKI